MVKIASDGGYLAAPVPLDTLALGPGDRAEIVVDTTGGPAMLIDANFGRVLELRTDPDLPTDQHPPGRLAIIEPITPDTIDVERTFHMDEVGDGWGINGEPPPPEDAGWEDTVLVTEDREVVIAARFDSYANPDIPDMFHCHILDHEDLGMMGQFKVVEN